MKKILSVIAFSLILNSCASRENLEFSLDTWIGHDVEGLVQHWGKPADINDYPNGKISYTWLFDDGIANSPIEGTINPVAIYCKITVDVSNNETIQSWQIEGNDCKA